MKSKIDFFGLFKKEIIILDDIMPSMLSPWRNYEYSEIVKIFDKTQIQTDCSTYQHYNQNRTYNENLNDLTRNYPTLKSKIKIYNPKNDLNSKLIYLLFYNNLIKYFDSIKSNNIPFTFTLYPGGGFGFGDKKLDENLKRMLDNKLFKGVIVNQTVSKKYLISQQICDESLISLIPGVPLNLETEEIKNYNYSKSLNKINILFFANKYTPDGSDKGFDVFQKIVSKLFQLKDNFNFIVIGGFNATDLTEKNIEKHIEFKGVLNEFEFIETLMQSHILISANRPFVLSENAFDGFPLATCVTASLYGNVNFMTDHFNEAENLNLIDNEDFIKINYDIDTISNKIIELSENKELLKKIALNGRNKILHLYGFDKQIVPRIEHFKKILF